MAARHGAVRAAIAALGEIPVDAPRPRDRRRVCVVSLALWMVTGSRFEPALFPACGDSSAIGWLLQGLQASISGSTLEARRYLEESMAIDPRPTTDHAFIEAWLDAQAGRWDRVVQQLEPFETQGLEPWLGRFPIRWLVAEAYEHLDRPEDAARHFELVLMPIRVEEVGRLHHYPLYTSFAHHRLVLLYSKMGRVEEARHHFEIFEMTFTNPDPELVPLVDEARRSLEAAETKI
jgi:hypothetical protein